MRGKLLVVAALALLPAAPAYGADLLVGETIDGAGDPGLSAAVVPWEGGTLEWRRCADGGSVCEPLPMSAYGSAGENSRIAYPGETPAGTVFEAVATKDGTDTKVRTVVWQGRIASTAPPVLQGEPAVGKTVTVSPGSWSGGWAAGLPYSAFSGDSVAACREPTGGECWLISYSGSVALEPRWAGWYLFAQESRYSGSSMGIPSLVPLPTPVTLRRSATVSASAPLGPVCCVAAPVVKKAPTASVRARALRRKGRLHVGRVTCETRCSVQLKVSGGKRRAVYRTLRVTGAKALTVPVRHGKLKVRVIVDGTLVTSGPTTAR